ncbi:hypothetical protein KIW84_014155 [Lathyrus oleraceus]|uniref:Uncharacterized protein n=1 Tax=Pisum sativum TaxID=3888 RepID=A0A9D5BLY2_PEA|nr:hypothetical protein KIW84_014155 [Pisum sativum]
MPSKVLEFKTPLQTLSTFVPLPTIQMLPPRVFGCVAFVTYIKTSVQSLIRVPFAACFWDMGEIPEEESKEESNWSTFDWFKDIDIPSTEVFGDSCQTQTDHMSPEVEVSKFPPSLVLNDPSPENIIEVNSPISHNNNNNNGDISISYELPHMHNRGKPPNTTTNKTLDSAFFSLRQRFKALSKPPLLKV